MQFRTKDLLVTVLPKAEIENEALAKVCLLRTLICRYPTIECLNSCLLGSCGHCSILGTCGHCSIVGTCGHCSILGTCGHCSLIGTCGACSLLVSGGCGILHSCGPGGSACDPTIFCPGASREPFVIQHLEDLVALKADLQETVKKLDAIQREGLPSRISSKADADALEAGLSEALAQVRAAKKGLK